MKLNRRTVIAGALGPPPALAAAVWARRRSRRRGPSEVTIRTADGHRLVTANGLPAHAVGDFPTAHDPVPLRAQDHALRLPLKPAAADAPRPLAMWWFGIAVN